MFVKILLVCLMQILTLSSALLTEVIATDLGVDLIQPTCDVTAIINSYDEKYIKYLLWTRLNSGDNEEYVLTNNDEENLRESNFDGAKNTYFLIVGFTDFGKKEWILTTKTKILQLEDANIISIEFSELVKGPEPYYLRAVCNSYKVADYTIGFIKWLKEMTNLSPSSIHIIGHSLGAQMAGVIGGGFRSPQLKRISGLDPAAPLYWNLVSQYQLNETHADFVDVIHTNACDLPPFLCRGMYGPNGHTDFYPNGGQQQPECGSTDYSCSHQRVTALYTETIVNLASFTGPSFKSTKCNAWQEYETLACPKCENDCVNMGFHLQKGNAGKFFLRTNGVSPYAQG